MNIRRAHSTAPIPIQPDPYAQQSTYTQQGTDPAAAQHMPDAATQYLPPVAQQFPATEQFPAAVPAGQAAQYPPAEQYPAEQYAPAAQYVPGAGPVPAIQPLAGQPGAAGGGRGNGGGKSEPEPLGFFRGSVRTFGELCITLGLVLILFVGWQLWWTDIAADQDNRDLTAQLQNDWQDDKPQAKGDPDHPVVGEPPAENKGFGILYIPRFGDRYYRTIAEGVAMEPVLNRMGTGHYPGAAMPGEKGNFAIAGHRVTYGKPLNQIAELRPGDDIVVQTKEGYYTYTFRNFDIVLPDKVDVLDPVPGFPEYHGKDRIMTLTACNPMFSARERYIAYATLSDFHPAADGPPDTIKDSPAYKTAGGK
nr:class E sortase [Brevibacterium sp. 68QC2CO]